MGSRVNPSRAASRVTSSSVTGTPAFAKCAATCAPITPAPSTAAERIIMAIPSLVTVGSGSSQGPSQQYIEFGQLDSNAIFLVLPQHLICKITQNEAASKLQNGCATCIVCRPIRFSVRFAKGGCAPSRWSRLSTQRYSSDFYLGGWNEISNGKTDGVVRLTLVGAIAAPSAAQVSRDASMPPSRTAPAPCFPVSRRHQRSAEPHGGDRRAG